MLPLGGGAQVHFAATRCGGCVSHSHVEMSPGSAAAFAHVPSRKRATASPDQAQDAEGMYGDTRPQDRHCCAKCCLCFQREQLTALLMPKQCV